MDDPRPDACSSGDSDDAVRVTDAWHDADGRETPGSDDALRWFYGGTEPPEPPQLGGANGAP
jgi:hypothetical protein